MGKTAAELMQQAKKLMEQAKAVEEANALKIGKYVMTNIKKLQLDDLLNYVKTITGGNGATEMPARPTVTDTHPASGKKAKKPSTAQREEKE